MYSISTIRTVKTTTKSAFKYSAVGCSFEVYYGWIEHIVNQVQEQQNENGTFFF